MSEYDLKIGLGGFAGQGIASVGNIMARIFARRGLNVRAYNAHQSLIRGGHTFLILRTGSVAIHTHGDNLDILVCLNQDTLDRHLKQMQPGTFVVYDGEKIRPSEVPTDVTLCALPISELSPNPSNKLLVNTVATGAVLRLAGFGIGPLDDAIKKQFARKGTEVVEENLVAAQAGYEFVKEHYKSIEQTVPEPQHPLAVLDGNTAMAMGAAAAGVKLYSAYPMSPATGILHWMAAHGRKLGIIVRQVEDELAVINMAIGAAHAGTRAMCATSGGGFALMTEAIGLAAMMETPMVAVNVQRAGPSTGVPTKTEQGDLWQVLGASQGDFPRVIVAPTDHEDCFNTIPELFNVVDRLQCPGLVLSDLLLSEGTGTVDPSVFNWNQNIDRGELITTSKENDSNGSYLRYKHTASGVSPRALPGLEGYVHVAASDEQDEDGVLISDMFTNTHKRQAMMDKRMRKMQLAKQLTSAPDLVGTDESDVTLVGWGSTNGVIKEAVQLLGEEGITANHLQVKWLVPLHDQEISSILSHSRQVIIIENNYSGQFARYLRSETGFSAHGHIRKYDGEPFLPHHVVEGVKEIWEGKTTLYVPVHEYQV